MKRLFEVCAGAAIVLLIMGGSASAQTVKLTANLTGGEESPAQIITGSFGTAELPGTVDGE